jgi:hypothetical protein
MIPTVRLVLILPQAHVLVVILVTISQELLAAKLALHAAIPTARPVVQLVLPSVLLAMTDMFSQTANVLNAQLALIVVLALLPLLSAHALLALPTIT